VFRISGIVLSMLEEYRHIPMVVMDWGEAPTLPIGYR
jgi:hypothetical protein